MMSPDSVTPFPVSLDQRAIPVYLAAHTQVLDHFPVQSGLVLATRNTIAPTQCEMDCAPNLLVKEDILDEAVDPVVVAQAYLAAIPRTAVHVQHGQQILLAFAGA